jgi:hypothetical protein
MDSPAYVQLLIWAAEAAWAMAFAITGTMHSVALGINGRAWWTPFVRIGVTSLNAILYACFAFGFWVVDDSSTAVLMYSWASAQAVACVFGATKDAYRVWREWNDAK